MWGRCEERDAQEVTESPFCICKAGKSNSLSVDPDSVSDKNLPVG